MRFAYLAPCAPDPANSGGALRVAALRRALAELGELRFAVVGEPFPGSALPYRTRRERPLQRVRRYLRAAAGADSLVIGRHLTVDLLADLSAWLAAERPDVVILGSAYLATLAPRIASSQARIVIDTHNAESRLHALLARRQRRPRARWRHAVYAWNTARIEARYFPMAWRIWTPSPADAAFYGNLRDAPPVAVVPNVVDVTSYDDLEPEEPGLIVYTGWYAYWPNVEAALALVAMSRRLRRDGVPHRVRLIGRDVPPALRAAAATAPDVEVAGEVADVRPHLGRASVVAVPLRSGSGTKLKILEAMAMQRAVVTTPTGAEGLAVRAGEHLEVESNDERFAARVRQLLDDAPRRRALGAAARTWVEAHASMDALRRAVATSLTDGARI